MIIAASWDDGTKDERLTDLFRKYEITATFFPVPKHTKRNIYEGFEVGNHTLTHPYLTKISDEQVIQEITSANHLLEDVLGRKIKCFAYPYGKGEVREANLVRSTGMRYARKTWRWQFDIEHVHPYLIPVHVGYNSEHFWKIYKDERKYFLFSGHAKMIEDWVDCEDRIKRMLDNGDEFIDMSTLVDRLNLRRKQIKVI